jgi:peroxiredoxin
LPWPCSTTRPATVVNFAQTRKLPFKVAIDNTGAVAKAWGDVQLTPTTYVVDKQPDRQEIRGRARLCRAAQADRKLLAEA